MRSLEPSADRSASEATDKLQLEVEEQRRLGAEALERLTPEQQTSTYTRELATAILLHRARSLEAMEQIGLWESPGHQAEAIEHQLKTVTKPEPLSSIYRKRSRRAASAANGNGVPAELIGRELAVMPYS